jgi:hypothetical protein
MKPLRWPALALAFLLAALPCHAGIEAVDLSALPASPDYRAEVESVIALRDYADHYSFDWRYPETKADVAAAVSRLEERTAALVETYPGNVDLRLFDLVLLGYLYNLDSPGAAARIEAEGARARADFPAEYRVPWLLGEFLAGAARPVEAVREFEAALALGQPPGGFPPAFHEDLAGAYFYARMYRNAMVEYEVAAAGREIRPEDYHVYGPIAEAFQAPDLDAEYANTAIWDLDVLDDGYRLTSRAMGISIPVKPSWKLRLTGYSQRRAIAMLTPDRLKSPAGTSIGISLLFWLSVEDMSYDDFVLELLKDFKVTARELRTVNGIDFEVYTWEDPSKYGNIGGAIGYYVFARLPAPSKPGLRIEYPRKIPKATGSGPSYLQLGEASILDRFDREVYLGVMMDSCHDIFPQASELFWQLLASTVLE